MNNSRNAAKDEVPSAILGRGFTSSFFIPKNFYDLPTMCNHNVHCISIIPPHSLCDGPDNVIHVNFSISVIENNTTGVLTESG